CEALTSGKGADAVLITAGTNSSQPVELAGELARDRGTVVVVGLVGMDVPRHIYYHKELQLKLSRSYGPGRYDPSYEEKGVDYPIGYVRWTERRNMDAFLQLVAEGKVRPGMLTTHRYPIERAADAYDLILGKAAPEAQKANGVDANAGSNIQEASETASPKGYRCGVVLEYSRSGERAANAPTTTTSVSRKSSKQGLGVGFVGAGGFARGVLLPILASSKDVTLTGIAAATGVSSKNTAQQFKFKYPASNYQQLLEDADTDSVFVATRHDSHASVAAEFLKRGKSVFVEKPLALTEDGLRNVAEAARASGALLFVGYNRRFSPLAREVKSLLGERRGALSIMYRINAGQMPRDHWALDPSEGGGRVIGEVCHFIDFVQF
ncbi:MAG: Gfo/Idh/MocA family oxidoreductase, partial [Blastocatellia bacterium]